MSRASVTASFPAMNSHAANGDPSSTYSENFTLQGHTLWEMCRYNHFQIKLFTGE